MTRLLGIFAAAIVALGLTAPKAEAVVIYDWTSTCTTGCTGQASAVLTLEDTYVPGTEVTDADFISFSYSSSRGAYEIPADAALLSLVSFERASLPTVSGAGDIRMQFAVLRTIFFASRSSWQSAFAPNGIGMDSGGANTWTLRQPTALSSPGPLPLFALGFAGLVLAGRRAKAAA